MVNAIFGLYISKIVFFFTKYFKNCWQFSSNYIIRIRDILEEENKKTHEK